MIDIFVVNGFLGSGKTTFLQEILASRQHGTGIIVNEVGQVGIDHLILSSVVTDVVLLPNGCLCCSAASGLVEAMTKLLAASEMQKAPLHRIVIETTGLADPRPIIASILTFSEQRPGLCFRKLITLVDCAQAHRQRDDQPEWLPQVMAADVLILSKKDQASAEVVESVSKTLRTLNPLASLFDKREPGLFERVFKDPGLGLHLRPRQSPSVFSRVSHANAETLSIVFDQPIDWMRFSTWLLLVLRHHHAALLRVKAVLWEKEAPAPILVQAAQKLVYPPIHWSHEAVPQYRSYVVLIFRGLDGRTLRDSLVRFLGIKESSSHGNATDIGHLSDTA